MNMAAIDKMVAASMKDVADSDEDVSDIDDPDLLVRKFKMFRKMFRLFFAARLFPKLMITLAFVL